MDTVSIRKLVEQQSLKVLTCEDDLDSVQITQSDINRPALQLAGFFDYFDHHRVQIIGQVEYTFMEKQGIEKSAEMMEQIMSYRVPCIIRLRHRPFPQR